jgi:hypothetical protein
MPLAHPERGRSPLAAIQDDLTVVSNFDVGHP